MAELRNTRIGIYIPDEDWAEKSEQSKQNGGDIDWERTRKKSHLSPKNRTHIHRIKVGI